MIYHLYHFPNNWQHLAQGGSGWHCWKADFTPL